MSAGEVAGVVAAVALAIGVVGLLLTMGALMRTLTAMRSAVEDFRRTTIPLLVDVHAAVRQTSAELGKVDTLLDRADSISGRVDTISGRVDTATDLAHRAFTAPLIKAMAFATGSAKAFRTLRKKD